MIIATVAVAQLHAAVYADESTNNRTILTMNYPYSCYIQTYLYYPQDSVAFYGNPCVWLFALGTSIAEFHDFFSRDPPPA